MPVTVIDKSGKAVGTAELPAVFSIAPSNALLHQSVERHLANRRAGTADTKRRDEVRGGGRKPWRQKGTGRARHGSIRSPIWRKGGVVFGPHPRSYAIAMTKAARRKALAMGFSAKAAAGELFIIDADGMEPAKTKDLDGFLQSIGRRKADDAKRKGDRSSTLFVVNGAKDAGAGAIVRCGRNLERVSIVSHAGVSVHALLAHDRVIVTKHAYDALAEVCGA